MRCAKWPPETLFLFSDSITSWADANEGATWVTFGVSTWASPKSALFSSFTPDSCWLCLLTFLFPSRRPSTVQLQSGSVKPETAILTLFHQWATAKEHINRNLGKCTKALIHAMRMMFWLLETIIERKVHEVFSALYNVNGETCISQKGARMLARNTGRRRRRSRGRIIRFLRRSSGLLLHKFTLGQQRKREKENCIGSSHNYASNIFVAKECGKGSSHCWSE